MTGQCWNFFGRAMPDEAHKIESPPSLNLWWAKSGRQDSNLRPPGPKPGALPGCATSRNILLFYPQISNQSIQTAFQNPEWRAKLGVSGKKWRGFLKKLSKPSV